jgi:trimeric autotransporter adhesin
MKGHLALPTIAALALAASFISLPLRAAVNPPKPGTISTVAGTGSPGYSGDNGPATQALLSGPFDLAFDAAGNLYIVDADNDRVRKVGAEGTITTVAGTGQPGLSGDNGKATAAQLKLRVGVVVDGAGDLFIADLYNHRVRKVTTDGIISTYAGTGPVDATSHLGDLPQIGGFSGDNGPATDARLNGPCGLAVDALGNLFIADYGNHRVRKVAPDGIITTVAGTGTAGFSGDGGKATDARLSGPVELAVDSAGNLFVAEFSGNHRVRKVDAVTGIITTVAGNGKIKYAGDGGLATDTGLRGPTGLAIDAMGNLLITDRAFPPASPYDERVLKVYGVAAPGLIAGKAFPR